MASFRSPQPSDGGKQRLAEREQRLSDTDGDIADALGTTDGDIPNSGSRG